MNGLYAYFAYGSNLRESLKFFLIASASENRHPDISGTWLSHWKNEEFDAFPIKRIRSPGVEINQYLIHDIRQFLWRNFIQPAPGSSRRGNATVTIRSSTHSCWRGNPLMENSQETI